MILRNRTCFQRVKVHSESKIYDHNSWNSFFHSTWSFRLSQKFSQDLFLYQSFSKDIPKVFQDFSRQSSRESMDIQLEVFISNGFPRFISVFVLVFCGDSPAIYIKDISMFFFFMSSLRNLYRSSCQDSSGRNSRSNSRKKKPLGEILKGIQKDTQGEETGAEFPVGSLSKTLGGTHVVLGTKFSKNRKKCREVLLKTILEGMSKKKSRKELLQSSH